MPHDRTHAFDLCLAAFGKDTTLLDACLMLRAACDGSADPISEAERDQCVEALRARLDVWEPPVLPKGARFDAAVRELVEATIAEVTRDDAAVLPDVVDPP